MDFDLQLIALVGALSAIAIPTVRALRAIFGHTLVLNVENHEYVFDATALEKTDVQTIDAATAAVSRKVDASKAEALKVELV